MSKNNTPPIVSMWSFYMPMAVFVALLALYQIMPGFYAAYFDGELGAIESAQALLLALGAGVAICAFRGTQDDKMMRAWLGLATVSCIYVCLEEVSYGQHWFGWDTPESIEKLNDQGETGLHNMSSWLDQKPRLLLIIGIVIGGLIVPMLRKFKPSALPKKFERFYPPSALIWVALLSVVAHLFDDIQSWVGEQVKFFGRPTEIEELYQYYFVLFYLVYLKRRLT